MMNSRSAATERAAGSVRSPRSAAPVIERAISDQLHAEATTSFAEGLADGVIASIAAFCGSAIAQRDPGEVLLTMETLADASGPGSARRMRIAIGNDDMPFLVDSIGQCLAASGLTIHLLLHPVLSVCRDEEGRLSAIVRDGDWPRESLIYLETDRVDAKGRAALSTAIRATLRDVRAAVSDWSAMIHAMQADADRLPEGEGSALLRWFLDHNLTQIGHETVGRDGKAINGLGICAADPANRPLSPDALSKAFAWFEAGHSGPLIIKSNQPSRVHRRVLADLFIVPIRAKGEVTALSIHVGLWTSAALAAPPQDVPILRAALTRMMEDFGYAASGHAGKGLVHALTALPHDQLVGMQGDALEELTLVAMSLADRPRPKLMLVAGALARHLFAFVWLPRDDVSTGRRKAIEAMLMEAANAEVVGWSIELEDSGIALLRFTLDIRGPNACIPDHVTLDQQLKIMVRGWVPAVEAALAEHIDAGRAAALALRIAPGFPQAYRDGAGPQEAAVDLLALQALRQDHARGVRLYRNAEDGSSHIRLKLYSLQPVSLSDAVPTLENFGFCVLEELTTPVADGAHGYIQKFVLSLGAGTDASAFIARADVIATAIGDVLNGRAENDRFSALIVSVGLAQQEVVLLRALFRYLRQTGSAYGLATVVDALQREAAIARRLIDLFVIRHDPGMKGDRDAASSACVIEIDAALEKVGSLDDDRILRLLRAIILATLRTNYFTPHASEALAFKLDSALVPGLPKPLPWREIWVYSPRVEGIHLRAGPIARGGLRWSDRRDDFRTEILGLMKAQRVKNAVIVPTGAKGGFYPKQLPNPALNRDAWLAEGTESYRIFIRTLLSVTDNLVAGKTVHPAKIVIHDGDDPYFVVAADKGTATFSDVANALAIERGFWLGDAFASGGSNGYDHKAMGITARGAWLSVQRHFLEMGVDVQKDPVRVIGVGDMSGDVFGNGMLLSKSIRLVAAFDHRHIFIDPDPDAAKSWKERKRLFKLPRSSWADYDSKLISKGGGVFPRSLKSIPLSRELQALLGTSEKEMEPAALMSALLCAQADLLWFGGIGTYIKAAAQNNADVGDSANDRIRVDAEDLRAKVIGEGANLGVTQAGRIAFALKGGRINTDFIDNSAGVDCSDNEVNIKIALNAEMVAGSLAAEPRNTLLASMTDDVAALVLEDNRLQALGLSIAQSGGVKDLNSFVRLIGSFGDAGRLDRRVEGLVSDQELLRRAQDGQGLTRPELAVLMSTAKLTLQQGFEEGDTIDDPLLDPMLLRSFPAAMQTAHADAIMGHQLRREIIATKLANRMVNRLGIILPFAIVDEQGCTLDELAQSFVIADALFGLDGLWADADRAAMSEPARLALFRAIAASATAHMGDVLRSVSSSMTATDAVRIIAPGIEALKSQLTRLVSEEGARSGSALHLSLIEAGVPKGLAGRVADLSMLDGAAGLAQMSGQLSVPVEQITRGFTAIGAALGIDWLQSTAMRLSPADPWECLLLTGVARDLQKMRLDFLAKGVGMPLDTYVAQWVERHGPRVEQFRALIRRAKAAPNCSAAMVAEIAGQASSLLSR